MQISRVTEATEELWEAFQRLVPQLTSNNPPPTRQELAALLNSESAVLLIARMPDDGPIMGAGSLTVYLVPTGVRAIIEDVIVDISARGQGLGEALVRRLLDTAKERGAKGVSLTSNPKREAANRLYRRMGFKLRETNAYYYRFQ